MTQQKRNRPSLRDIALDFQVVAGAGLVTAGLWWWWPPAGLMGLGAMLVFSGLRLARRG